jgi:CRISPR-associated endonuclease/helicase Cas3
MVLVPSNRDLSVLVGAAGRPRNHHGLGSVYHDLRVLEATWQALCEHSTWTIPAMSRALVEGCLHSTRLDEIVRECGAQFAEHRTYLLGEWLGHRRTAELNLVDWNKPYAEMTFPTAVNERIQTRLGEGDRRVQFTPPVPGPFGLPVRELSIPAWWAAGVSADEETASNVTTQASVTRFSFGPKRFIYDRLGLRIERVSDTKEEKDDDGP